jgi:hypothetical protein
MFVNVKKINGRYIQQVLDNPNQLISEQAERGGVDGGSLQVGSDQ